MSPEILVRQYPWVFAILAMWEVAWKGIALWRSAKNNHKYWFVAILIINSVGILPIVYLLCCRYHWFGCCQQEKKTQRKK